MNRPPKKAAAMMRGPSAVFSVECVGRWMGTKSKQACIKARPQRTSGQKKSLNSSALSNDSAKKLSGPISLKFQLTTPTINHRSRLKKKAKGIEKRKALRNRSMAGAGVTPSLGHGVFKSTIKRVTWNHPHLDSLQLPLNL